MGDPWIFQLQPVLIPTNTIPTAGVGLNYLQLDAGIGEYGIYNIIFIIIIFMDYSIWHLRVHPSSHAPPYLI